MPVAAGSMSNLVFDKYEIQHRIAIGGMGEVFFAIQRGVSGFERPVILKSLLPDLAQQQELVNQFLDEARVAATLNHPNVVSIFEVGLWNGTFYIAMEYIRGRNLSQLIRKSMEQQVRLPPLVAARIIRESAMGLDHAHRASDSSGRPLNIVHRDISPQNIMVREDGVAKVVDFGIASAANRSTRTATGTLKGKLAYMAPEQVLAQPMTPKVDQFALGIVFWEMLVSRRLFKADNDLALVKLVLEQPIPRPDSLAPDVPPQIADVVMRMLDRDAERRFDSLADVADALESLLVTPTPALSPGAFMRRLGTDDLKIEVKPAATGGENFVISLSGNRAAATPAPAEVEVNLVTAATKPTPVPAARFGTTKKKSGPSALTLAAGFGLALVLAAVVVGVLRKPAEVTPPPPPQVVTPPPPTPTEPVKTVAPVVATPKDGTLELTTTPPGATLRVDGRPIGTSPQKLNLAPGTHYLLAELPGFERSESEVVITEGALQPLTLTLKPHGGGTRPPTTRPTPPTTTAPVTATKNDPGFLTIATTPWSKVTIDGELMGSTPLFKLRLAAGAHKVQFINEGESINVTKTITVAPGETQKLQLKLP